MLYQLPDGFFVEVNYDVAKNEIEFFFAFEADSEEDWLAAYAAFVNPPDWVPDAK